jgi:hypothetical protein
MLSPTLIVSNIGRQINECDQEECDAERKQKSDLHGLPPFVVLGNCVAGVCYSRRRSQREADVRVGVISAGRDHDEQIYAITMSLLRICVLATQIAVSPSATNSMARLSRELVINFEARNGAY